MLAEDREEMAETTAFQYWREREQSVAMSKKGFKTPPPLRAKPKRVPQKSALVDLDSGGSSARAAVPSAETFAPCGGQTRRPQSAMNAANMTLPPNYTSRVPSTAPPPAITAIANRSSSTSGDSSNSGSGRDSFAEAANLGKATGTRRSLFLDDRPIVPPERPPPPKRWSLNETKVTIQGEKSPPARKITPDGPFLVRNNAELRAKSSRDRTKDEQRCLSLVSEEGMSTPSPFPSFLPASLGDEAAHPTGQAASARHPRLAWLPRSQSVVTRGKSGVGEDSGKTTPKARRQPTKSESFVSYVQEEEVGDEGKSCNVEVGGQRGGRWAAWR